MGYAVAVAACRSPSPAPVGPDAPAEAPDAAIPDASPPAPCTFAVDNQGPYSGQCTAVWQAMDAGSVSHFTRHAFTISGIAGSTPWSVSDAGVLDPTLGDYTLDIMLGSQVWHLRGDLAQASDSGLSTLWTGDGGVALHLTAGSVETFAYSHFRMHDVHGSFDMDQPVAVHARF
jgi:hypothetical protein